MMVSFVTAGLMMAIILPVTKYQENTPDQSGYGLKFVSQPVITDHPSCQYEDKPYCQQAYYSPVEMASPYGIKNGWGYQNCKQRVHPMLYG